MNTINDTYLKNVAPESREVETSPVNNEVDQDQLPVNSPYCVIA